MPDTPFPRPVISRRTLLTAAGAGTLAVALAACTADAPPTPTRTATPSPAPWIVPDEPMSFPSGFTWGAATSAYQVEGSLAADGRTPSVWDTFAARAGTVRDGSNGEPAADQYRRYEEDIDLMASLGLAAYRFSLSWSRIVPTSTGTINSRGIDHYRRMLDALASRGIRPAITLFHWDLPQWVQDAGGWVQRETADRFAEYAAACFDAFGDVDTDWMTLNEPKTHAFVGHWYGAHAPGLRSPDVAAAAVHHQLLAHGRAVERFRLSGAAGRIGIALNLIPVYPTDPDKPEAARRVDARENRLFLDPILLGTYPEDAVGGEAGQLPADPVTFQGHQKSGDLETISAPLDFLAVQYYGVTGVNPGGRETQIAPTSSASWQQVLPEGLYDLLTRLAADYPAIPLVITENGIPDRSSEITVDDPERLEFFRGHFQQAARAIGDGVPLEGYYVWSLLDNFEWAEGYTQRWGIVAVDFETQERLPKRSAGFYADVIAANAVPRA